MLNPIAAWRGFLARPNDDRVKVFGVAFLVALTSAILVSASSVMLKPLQEANLEAERAARMEAMLDTLPGMRDVLAEIGAEALETRMVDLATGSFTTDVTPDAFDLAAATSDPELSVAIPPDEDIAGLGRRANFAPVHLLERDGELLVVVLPVSGKGYQSTIRAMVALNADLETISALTITEQAETPGLGARVEDPDWLSLWPGKEIADDTGRIVISVVRGEATGPHEVDGISGATMTSNGVGNMLRFWLGEQGFGPFLDRLRTEGL